MFVEIHLLVATIMDVIAFLIELNPFPDEVCDWVSSTPMTTTRVSYLLFSFSTLFSCQHWFFIKARRAVRFGNKTSPPFILAFGTVITVFHSEELFCIRNHSLIQL